MFFPKIFLRCTALLALVGTELSSCNLTAGIDTLLSAPRLTLEQEQIYQALQQSAGSNISLKYPKSGEYLSAFTVADLDNDGADEAIVFYEVGNTPPEESPLRICLLDQQNGGWHAITHSTAAGAEVEWLTISRLGENERVNIIIGYSKVDGAERTAEVLHYENGDLIHTLSPQYSYVDVCDLNHDNAKELLVVTAATLTTSAAATVYALDRDGTYYQSGPIPLPDSFTDISHVVYGKLPTENSALASTGSAIYIDGLTGATTLQTEIITYLDGDLQIQYMDSPERLNSSRSSAYASMDIDKDGEVEIPVQTVFYGYSNAEETDKLPMVCWYVCRGGMLLRKSASYYDAAKGYVFLMPERWEKKVTAVMERDELVFYELDTEAESEDGMPVCKAPLLHIAVAETQDVASILQASGYTLQHQRGDSYYLTKIEDKSRNFPFSPSDLLFALRYI